MGWDGGSSTALAKVTEYANIVFGVFSCVPLFILLHSFFSSSSSNITGTVTGKDDGAVALGSE